MADLSVRGELVHELRVDRALLDTVSLLFVLRLEGHVRQQDWISAWLFKF